VAFGSLAQLPLDEVDRGGSGCRTADVQSLWVWPVRQSSWPSQFCA